MDFGGAANILIEDCSVRHSMTLVDGVDGAVFRNCNIANTPTAMQIYGHSHVSVDNCQFVGISVVGIEITMGQGAVCEIVHSDMSGGQGVLFTDQPGGRFIASDSRLEGGTYALFTARGGPGICSIQRCDLIKGSGPMVRCGDYEPPVVHDLRNNFWGTTSATDIQSWIIDHNDDPNIAATVLYTPFAGQSVPAETTTWGDLKALFR
jgi:hypothetical protein